MFPEAAERLALIDSPLVSRKGGQWRVWATAPGDQLPADAGTVHVVTEVQTCYRHPDRRAGVRCQRCDRAICPSCMQQASVGFHCPECVKSAGQKVITTRTLAALMTPYVTYVLIGANVLIYLVSTLAPGGTVGGEPGGQFQLDWALIGNGLIRTAAGFMSIGVADGELYRLITGGFLHASLLHLGFNMFVLFSLGKQLEPALGRRTFTLVYFVAMLGGAAGVMIADPGQLTVGASGAVFGLFGYAFVAQKARGINPMDTGLGGVIIVNLLFTFLVPGISIGGHLGGLVTGAAAAAIVDYLPRQFGGGSKLATVGLVGLGAVCFALAVATAGRV